MAEKDTGMADRRGPRSFTDLASPDDADGRRASVRAVDEVPALSVTTPTYQRPDDLVRALRSVTDEAGREARHIELVVSDNSTDTRSEDAIRPILDEWQGPSTYVRHDPSLDKIANQNACIRLATGRWVHILHDDDYLLPGGVRSIIEAIVRADADERVLLFGVHVVDERGSRWRHQRFLRRRRLTPEQALRRLLGGSSFVRMPAICVRRDAYDEVGTFDGAIVNANDTDMWIRLFARFGVTTVPSTTSAYVIHSQAASEAMFDADGIEQILELYRRAELTGLLSRAELRRRRRTFLHQFILAGCFRRLTRRDWRAAREVIALFDLPSVAELGWSRRWAPVRLVFSATSAALAPRS